MKSILVLLFSLCISVIYGQSIRPGDVVQESLSQGKQFKSTPIFRLSPQNFRSDLPQEVAQFDFLTIEKNQINSILNSDNPTLEISIPSNSRSFKTLQLVEVDNLDFLVKDGLTGNIIPYVGGKHYRGIVKGKEKSLVAISIFQDEVAGLIIDPDEYGNQVIGKMEDSPTHIIYNDPDVLTKLPFSCETEDSGVIISEEVLRGDNIDTRALSDCVRFLFEVDNTITNDKGGATGATNYVTALYNQVAILYAAESINTTISEINIYTDSNDPYSGSASNMLNQVQSRLSSGFNGDLAMVLALGLGGGVAYVDVLCASSQWRVGVSGINSTYSNVPTYSWSVEVLAHELGHLFGSDHTHACSWNGNGTAIDGCGPAAGYSEGCSAPLPTKGTIMSYCHLVGGVGIDLNLGFGPQPGNLIRSRVTNASCLQACSSGGATCTDGIQNQGETGIDCGGPCAACVTCNDGIQNGDETGIDCGGSCPNSCGGGNNIFGSYFESGFDGWSDGGSDCARYASTSYAAEGTYSIQLRDNSGTGSSMTSPSQNLSQYSSVNLSFSFYMNSMETGEDFFLDFYNGSSWVRLATYASGSGYSNGVTYNRNVTVSSGLSSNNQFRFTCDASSNADQVYIDAVVLTADGGGGGPTCSDGVQNGNETGVDCGGPDCPSCPVTPTCTDGVQNGNETGVDCGGPDCPSCPVTPTCTDGVQNGNETGVDCGGPDCPSCPVTPTCTDGVQNGNETGVDCGGPDCPSCPVTPTCTDGVQNGNETGVDCGGPDCSPCGGGGTIFGHYFETGFDGWADGGSDCARYASATYAAEGTYSIQLRDNSGTGSSMTSPSQNLSQYSSVTLSFSFYMNSMETGEDFFLDFYNGSSWVRLATYASGSGYSNGVTYTKSVTVVNGLSSNNQFRFTCDASSNADQVYIDAVILTSGSGGGGGGPTCTDGIQNGNETGIDCGGPDCPSCPVSPTCTDGIQNGNETGIDCGGPDCPSCPVSPTCTDGVQNGNETGVDCGGPDCPSCPVSPTCTDGIQNGNETGVDCGGPDCAPCGGTGGVALFGNGHYFETGMDGWADGGSDCARYSSTTYAAEGSWSVQLRDNSGTGSSMTSPTVNLSSFSSVRLEFGLYSNSLESGEQFLVKFSSGGAFTTIVSAASGTDFSNGINYAVTLDLPASSLTFGTNSKFMIECNASSNADQVYIDAVKLTGYTGAATSALTTDVNFIAKASTIRSVSSESVFYPNPASDILNMKLQTLEDVTEVQENDFSKINMSIYSITGQVVKSIVLDNNYNSTHQIDISDLPSGTYLVKAIIGDEPIVEKIQVIK
jgi:uncharacterized protein YfiM (DUF2279 family)